MSSQGPLEPTEAQLDKALTNFICSESNEALAADLRLSVKALEMLALKWQEQKNEQLILGDW